ncbi:hypothetical protein [Paracoccus lutimaris]|uniref:Uncharacterized protein n=1 Tax=Paracoccus lutimaris TaxID=1490030 RepID=A0A368Z6P0_9RHOB|nr:hypothetical protein [Paracoccus lutimaris]RCW88125.1 hypothetical protein DFP89_10254 [Paracoccus lutimaris]
MHLAPVPAAMLTAFLAVPLFAQPAPTDSRPVVMMCQMIDESGTGWVPDFLMLTRQTSGPNIGRIEVFDPVLKTLVRHPIQAQITADNGKSRSYGWALAGVRNANGQRTDRLDYRLTVDKADGRARLSAVAQGYDNTMTGSGVCASPGPTAPEPARPPRR